MSSIAGIQSNGWARGGLRALFRALRRWWTKERYRPERRYMRG